MKMSLKDTHAKTQRRKEVQVSKAQPFFAPLRLYVSICLCFFAVSATAQTTNDLSDAEIQGRQLAQEILEQRPTTNFTQTGALIVRDSGGKHVEFSIIFKVYPFEPHSWFTEYSAVGRQFTNDVEKEIVEIQHMENETNWNWYSHLFQTQTKQTGDHFAGWPGDQKNKPYIAGGSKSFASSDFSVYDLGLEFFHWPAQKILKKDVHRSRGCIVLESTNPNPSTNGYSRVVSWIDNESLGIVEAYAYDANGKLLKDFYPKDFKKVNGQWQVQTLVMENVQTGSRSRLEFDLNRP